MKIKWLGHASFEITFRDGNVVLLDPWLDNPKAASGYTPERVDAIALTHGHSDHVGSASSLAKQFSPKIFAGFELSAILQGLGLDNVTGFQKGGTVDLGFVRLTMTNAFHSSSYQDGDKVLYAGEPAGFIMRATGEPSLYCAGDTCVFGDMALIGELYKPEIAILPVGGHYTMDPYEAAHAARLLKVKTVIPMHYGTFPLLTGTPDKLAEYVSKDGIEIADYTVGEEREW